MDSLTNSKSRAHSRLASLGRIRSRGSIHNTAHPRPANPAAASAVPLPLRRSETLPLRPAVVPVSPSDTSSYLRSDLSTRSKSSSDTTYSEDKSDDTKSIEERPLNPTTRRPTQHFFGERTHDDAERADSDAYARAVQHTPRMMHQTSSRLLRMTEDERPFTRVRITRLPLHRVTVYGGSLSWLS